MKLNTGVCYLAVQEAGQIIISDTEKYDFEEKCIEFKVMEKPERVIAQDDVSKEEVDLPEHLKSDEWYFITNLHTGKSHWLNTTAYQISPLVN